MPNSNSKISPVATPTAKLMPKIFIQNCVRRRQKTSPRTTYRVSMMPMMTPRPSVSGTKSQWYMAVSANCARDQSISEVSMLIDLEV